MAGPILAAALVLVAGAGAVGIGAIAGAAGVAQAASGVADNAALAAADVAMGLTSGDPCAVASRIARASGVDMVACDVAGHASGVTIAVVVEARFGVFPIRVAARAGNEPL